MVEVVGKPEGGRVEGKGWGGGARADERYLGHSGSVLAFNMLGLACYGILTIYIVRVSVLGNGTLNTE